MKQQVNFYTEEFKPKSELLSLENMMLVWIAGIVFTLALYNFENEKAAFAKENWQRNQSMEQHQQRQLQSLQTSFANRGDALVLEKTFQGMELSLSQRKYVLNQLSQRVDGMSEGIAGLMENLASISIKGLWLTAINVNQGQLSVSGLTDDPEKVPVLIQQLQNITALQDKRFARLEITIVEDNEELLQFTLQSENQISGSTSGGSAQREKASSR